MLLTWLGHSCFLLEQDGYTILLDPYTGVDGYPPLEKTAAQVHANLDPSGRVLVNKVLCSHQHQDHHAVELASLLPEAPCPFAVRTVGTFHDEQGGALRGSNTIHILQAGGLTVAHLGDLGHPLSPEQCAAVGPLDAVLVPVGGYYTIDAPTAKAVCETLRPRRVIPMHYRAGSRGYPVLSELKDFLSLWPSATRLDGPSLTLEDAPEGVVVPKL